MRKKAKSYKQLEKQKKSRSENGQSKSTAKPREKAVLVAVANGDESIARVNEHLEELKFLAGSSGVTTLSSFIQRLDHPDGSTFVGKGKLVEISDYVQENHVDTVIFDDDLSPSQVRNLEQALKCKILDRSLLILNIFSLRAKTAQAKTQVELAQYQYLLPRLTNMWTHLSKQKGGIGTKGPGEKELETDRRMIRDKISLYRKKLQKIDKQNVTRRKSREGIVRVALVGYTNVGKSTIMRKLAKTEAFAEDKLFATVDSTVRKVVIDRIPFLLTDTVGFIRKLPHTLVECFKSTLDEVREADVLIHAVDVSHPHFEEQMQIVNKTLIDIGAGEKPTLRVFNKTDLFNQKREEGTYQEGDENMYHEPLNLEQLRSSYLNNEDKPAVFISAEQNDNISRLREVLIEMVREEHYKIFPNYLKNETY